jgi:hypothetical protein
MLTPGVATISAEKIHPTLMWPVVVKFAGGGAVVGGGGGGGGAAVVVVGWAVVGAALRVVVVVGFAVVDVELDAPPLLESFVPIGTHFPSRSRHRPTPALASHRSRAAVDVVVPHPTMITAAIAAQVTALTARIPNLPLVPRQEPQVVVRWSA